VALNGDDGNNGIDAPFKTVGRAIDETNVNGTGVDNIIINPGTYNSSYNVEDLSISNDVNIYSAKYFDSNKQDTILDAEGISRFFTIESGVNVNFYGIIFQNGKTTDVGGAIYSNGGECNLNGVSFVNCSSSNGGAVYINGGSVNFTGCDFVNNKADIGSVIYVETGDCNVEYSRFADNKGSYIIFNNDGGSVIANYNWWGNNNNPKLQVSDVDITSWFIMVLTPLNTTPINVGEEFIYRYSLELYNITTNTSETVDSSRYLPSFNVLINYMGPVEYKDARNSYPFSLTVLSLNSTIYAIDYGVGNMTPLILTFEAGKGNTSIIVYDVVGDYGKFITLTAKLVNQRGEGIADQLIFFKNSQNQYIGSGVWTDINGIATIRFIPEANAGKYSYSAVYEGSLLYFGSNGKATIVINKVQTTHTSANNFKGNYGKVVTLKSILKDVHGNPLSLKLVDIWVNGKKVGSALTDKNGQAIYKHNISKTGNLIVEFRYNGDNNFIKSSAKSTLSVKKHSIVSITNAVKKGKTVKLTSTIKNGGPDKLTAKVTYKLAKGLKAVKISKKLGTYTYNKKTRTITFKLNNFAKSGSKLAKLVLTLNKSIKGKKYLTNKVTSSNTLSVSVKNK